MATEKAIQSLAAQRDAVVLQMRGLLYGTGHGHSAQLIRQGLELLGRAWALSRS